MNIDKKAQEFFEHLKQMADPLKEGGVNLPSSTPIYDLCNKDIPEMQWMVDGLFTQKTINQISAAPNNWKTWVTMHLAIQIAKGDLVFEKFKTSKQNVLVVNEEDPDILIQPRAKRLQGAVEGLGVNFYIEEGIQLTDNFVERLIEEMKRTESTCIIFDSLSVIHTADENSAREMNGVFNQMKKFVRQGYTVLFTNHHRKKSQNPRMRDDSQEQTRGSSVINAVPAGHITCQEFKKDGENFVLIHQVKLKGAKKMNPFLVRINEPSDKMIQFTYAEEFQAQDEALVKTQRMIMEILQKNPQWLSVKDLVAMKVGGDSTIRGSLRALEKTGALQGECRRDLEENGVVLNSDGQHNEKLYNLTDINDRSATT